MLRAILNKSWRQHPTRHQLYGYLPPITKTIQVRRTRHAGHCWRSRDELISDVLLWTTTYIHTYIQQLCEDTECSPVDLPEVMNDRKSGEKGSGISVLVTRHDDDFIKHFYKYFSFSRVDFTYFTINSEIEKGGCFWLQYSNCHFIGKQYKIKINKPPAQFKFLL